MAKFADPTEVTAPDFEDLRDYVGDVLVFEPTAYEEGFKTSRGPTDVMHAAVGVYSVEKNEITGLGAQVIFWVKVIEQLRDSLEHGTVVIARLVREGKAYTLDAVDAATREKAEKAYSWAP